MKSIGCLSISTPIFASIEQELCPELRGPPIAIVPIRVGAPAGCIAVSYQSDSRPKKSVEIPYGMK
jgi:hypothetical protein